MHAASGAGSELDQIIFPISLNMPSELALLLFWVGLLNLTQHPLKGEMLLRDAREPEEMPLRLIL